jgi:hypothetical protein
MNGNGQLTYCSMHAAAIKSLDRVTNKADSIERRFLILQKDLLAVVADLQAASAKSTEQLSKYHSTLSEILRTVKDLAKDKHHK